MILFNHLRESSNNDLENRLHQVVELDSETNEDIKTELSWNIDFQKVQLANQYQALKLLLQDEDNIQFIIEFDDVINDEDIKKNLSNILKSITEVFNSMSSSQSCRSSQDLSEALS